MTDSSKYTHDQFIACKWRYDVLPEERFGYFSVTQSLHETSKEKSEAGQEEQAQILELLGRATSMMLTPDSLNEPFKPYFQDYQVGKRSALPEDFTTDELAFFEDILNSINEPWLKARLADLLWLCKKPKKTEHVKLAIESYLVHGIDPDTWRRGINDGWERAALLSKQIGDFDKLNDIKSQLFAALGLEYPSSKFMVLWVADLLDRLKIDKDLKEDIAPILFRIGNELREKSDLNSARAYFELATKKYQQCSDEEGRLRCLISIADCFEREADSRSKSSNMAANSFYENAIQAYRRVPAKHREIYDVNNKIKVIRTKITDSGQASLDEMVPIETSGEDISRTAELSIKRVSGKNTIEEALIHFTKLYPGPEYTQLTANAKENMKQNIGGSIFGFKQMSSDGRVVSKTPPMDLNAGEDHPTNQATLHWYIQQNFAAEAQIVAEGLILPALKQMLMEHRVTKELLIAICHHSPIVPQDRQYLLGYALWLGFEYNFGNAIHLLCPQVEHIVRIHLKKAGASTSNIDPEGIEQENGLSTLMDLPKAAQIFGEDLVFEMKSVFTDTKGFNLRNEVAHGLLDDKSSSTFSTVYAWWMILRLVIHLRTSDNTHLNEEA